MITANKRAPKAVIRLLLRFKKKTSYILPSVWSALISGGLVSRDAQAEIKNMVEDKTG